jgi:hypothetical protein
MSKLRIEPYDGTTDVVQWVERFKLVITALTPKWKEEPDVEVRTMIELKLALRGSLVDWFKTISVKAKTNEVLEEMILFINGPYAKMDKRAAAFGLKQDDCSGVAEYYVKKMALLHDCLEQEDFDKMSADLFLDGLSSELRNWVLMQPAKDRVSSADMRGKAEAYEKLMGAKSKEESINVAKFDERLELKT